MAPRAAVLGEIITYGRLGDYYLKEIISRRSHSRAPSQPKNPFSFWPFTCIYIVANVQKKREKEKRALLAYIRSKRSEYFILVFQVHQKKRSLQKNKEKIGRLSQKKKKKKTLKS